MTIQQDADHRQALIAITDLAIKLAIEIRYYRDHYGEIALTDLPSQAAYKDPALAQLIALNKVLLQTKIDPQIGEVLLQIGQLLREVRKA